MNCPQCQEQLVEYLEGALEDATQVEAHVLQCPSCRAELEALQHLCGSLKTSFQPAQKASLDGAVMNRIVTAQAAQLRRLKMRKRIQLFGTGAAAVAAAACFILFVLPAATPDRRALAAEALAKGAEETKGLKSVHLKCRMRTLPQDNFSLIGETYGFVGVEIWKQFGDPAKYRIEKPGRVLVCDGKATVMLVKTSNTAARGPAGANFDAGWLRDLADTEKVLSEQLRESFARNGDLSLKNETIEGKPKQVVSVEIKAADVGDYMRNQFLMTSDTRRVFQFDAASKRLEQMKIILHAKAQDVVVFEVTSIDYNPELAASLFALELPEDVVWLGEPAPLPDSAKYSEMTPRQVAETFFNACAKEDWDEAGKFWHGKIDKRVKEYLGGLKVVSLGEAFQSKPYAGWFVPYEFTQKSGATRKHNLAVRNDNPAKRWTVDGGI